MQLAWSGRHREATIPDHALRRQLSGIDGRDYGAYRSLQGVHAYDGFELDVAKVPRDPFAPPGTGVFRVRVPLERTGLRPDDLATPARDVATRDWICRRFHAEADRLTGGRRGTGWSGVVTLATPGQAVLDRNAVVVADSVVEVRAFVGLPARGRKVDAGVATTMLVDELPAIVAASLWSETLDREAFDRHVATVEDAQALRSQLGPNGLVAFLADDARLPRASGVDDRPMSSPPAVPFRSPETMRVTLDTPHAGRVTGLGIPTGVTVLVGGGYNGKSTVLSALAAGVHDHVPGDGRERCVALPTTFPVPAAPGRSVAGVDVSGFITGLPDGRDTTVFSSTNASGSTSQAAAIAEAVEAGATALLVDEDSSASNLLVRDARMQALVHRDDEPITVLLDRVRELHDRLGISTVLVMGGAGDYLDVADHVIQLNRYVPSDVTGKARRVAAELPTQRRSESPAPFTAPRPRTPRPGTVSVENDHGKRRARPVARDRILLGEGELDLRDVAGQLREEGQTRTLAVALTRLADRIDGRATVRSLIDALTVEVAEDGLDILDPGRVGQLSAVRALDLAAALNRVRGLACD